MSVTVSDTLGWLVKSRRETELAIADHNAWFDSLGPRFLRMVWVSGRVRGTPFEYIGRERVVVLNGLIVWPPEHAT